MDARVTKPDRWADYAPLHIPFNQLQLIYGESRTLRQLRRAEQQKGKDGKPLFPEAIQLSAGRIAWIRTELDEHYSSLPRAAPHMGTKALGRVRPSRADKAKFIARQQKRRA